MGSLPTRVVWFYRDCFYSFFFRRKMAKGSHVPKANLSYKHVKTHYFRHVERTEFSLFSRDRFLLFYVLYYPAATY